MTLRNIGFVRSSDGECQACPAGTYRPAGESQCLACASGRISPGPGSAFCTTCPLDTYSDSSGVSCVQCPAGSLTNFPGNHDEAGCLTPEEANAEMDARFGASVLVNKLVSLPAFNQPKRECL